MTVPVSHSTVPNYAQLLPQITHTHLPTSQIKPRLHSLPKFQTKHIYTVLSYSPHIHEYHSNQIIHILQQENKIHLRLKKSYSQFGFTNFPTHQSQTISKNTLNKGRQSEDDLPKLSRYGSPWRNENPTSTSTIEHILAS